MFIYILVKNIFYNRFLFTNAFYEVCTYNNITKIDNKYLII